MLRTLTNKTRLLPVAVMLATLALAAGNPQSAPAQTAAAAPRPVRPPVPAAQPGRAPSNLGRRQRGRPRLWRGRLGLARHDSLAAVRPGRVRRPRPHAARTRIPPPRRGPARRLLSPHTPGDFAAVRAAGRRPNPGR